MMNEVQYYNDIRLNYIDDINELLILGYRSKAILSFKYDHLNFVINTMQILIIFISAALTLMESIKTYYNSENEAIDITAILFTSFIGIIMTLYRFLKLENKKERTGNILENYNLILNKLQRVKNTMENMVIKNDNTEEWAIISNSYTSEILGTYIGIKEAYDNNFSYKEALHYKTKYGKFLLQEKFVGNELKTIYNFRDEPHVEFKYSKLKTMIKGRKFDYNGFIRKYDQQNKSEVTKKRKQKKSNQQLYFDFLDRDNKQNSNYLQNLRKARGVEIEHTSSSEEIPPPPPQGISQTGIPMNVMSSCSLSPRPRRPRPVCEYDENSRFNYYRKKNSRELEEGSESEVLTGPPSHNGYNDDFYTDDKIVRNSPTFSDLTGIEGEIPDTNKTNDVNANLRAEVTDKKSNKTVLEL
jgi:heme/copper-type cytochrome/quinol oxidase subunit 4